MSKDYVFSVFNKSVVNGLSVAINSLIVPNKEVVFVCIGSDLVVGDAFGPLVGSFLRNNGFFGYVYGTLESPVTANEVRYIRSNIKKMHPNSLIIAIDAAVGQDEDVGLIKVSDTGLLPGLGVKKDLPKVGDVSIVGVVAGKSIKNVKLFNLTRLGLVYKMSKIVSEAVLNITKRDKELNLGFCG